MKIQFYDDNLGKIGVLRPLSHEDLENQELLEILAMSRNSYRGSFFTDTVSDVNTTRNFLLDCLSSRTRFIFLIYVYKAAFNISNFYGHLGYEIINNQRIELINVMRVPHIESEVKMQQPLSALLFHLRKNFPNSQLFLKVLKSNERAIAMYSRCGFKMFDQESTDNVITMIM